MHGFNKTISQKFQGRCPVCGVPFTRSLVGRRKRFCSDRCRDEARRAFNFSVLGRCRGEPRNDAKGACAARGKTGPTSGRPPDICGPRHVIEAELEGALTWSEDPPGSGRYVAQLQPRALREVSS
jgi:hypothetical protein